MSSSKKSKIVVETDVKIPDGRYKNTNKFCKKVKCKHIKDCWKGKVAAIACCEDYAECKHTL
jgi:hypothetical protein